MVNRLAKETSPYLQQHKENPVDWWPYIPEAFELAKKEGKPVFISIGYSTCHWCHVMARESFQNPLTAAYMNEHFVNIKIDREELPGIDKVYQEMFQMLHHRGGGWPLSVWTNHDGSPFFIGTYFPDEERHGLPSFMDVNRKLVDYWINQPELLDQQAGQLVNSVNTMASNLTSISGALSEDLYYKEIIALQQRFDRKYGGIGQSPKFPRISSFRFLLQESISKDIKDVTGFVRFTFHQMAKGGIYDQIGGGFARYSVDRFWQVPHFEKMLYDNGGLIQLGAEIAAVVDDPFVEFIVKDTIGWLAREMQAEEGGFYSAQNADSEGREGTFYVWHDEQVDRHVEKISVDQFEAMPFGDKSEEEIRKLIRGVIKDRYNITSDGNFKDPHHPEITGMNVLSLHMSINELAHKYSMTEGDMHQLLQFIRQYLFDSRQERIPPSTDTKIITSWNAILIRGLFSAAQLLNYPTAATLARQSLDFILSSLVTEAGVLRSYHTKVTGTNHRYQDGVLDDYSLLIASCIDAYEYSGSYNYIDQGLKILQLAIEKFWDEDTKIFYLNQSDNDIFKSAIQFSDDSMVSGLGIMVSNLFKIGKYAENKSFIEMGEQLAKLLAGNVKSYPGAMDSTLIAATPYLRYPTEIVMIGKDDVLKEAILGQYIPNRLIYWYEENKTPDWEVIDGRNNVEKPTVYICRGQTCSLPISEVEALMIELKKESNIT